MEYNEFLNQVQQRGDLNSHDEAEDAVHTTFTTLARRLPESTTTQIMSLLPPELARYFKEAPAEAVEPFTLDSFFQRVNEEEGIDMPTASQYVRAVMDALRQSLSPEQYQRLRADLPEEFNSMFDTGGEQAA